MDVLSLLGGCSLIVSAHCSPSPAAKPVSQWHPMVAKAADTFALPEAWVSAVMARESGGRTALGGRPITSKAGAMGLMQLMPRTYADLRRQYGLGADPYAPSDNIFAGTAYLHQMYVRYGYPGMFAAYNAGPGRFDAYLLGRKPLPDETLSYLSAIVPGSETAYGGRASPSARLTKSRAGDGIFVSQAAPGALFVPLINHQF